MSRNMGSEGTRSARFPEYHSTTSMNDLDSYNQLLVSIFQNIIAFGIKYLHLSPFVVHI